MSNAKLTLQIRRDRIHPTFYKFYRTNFMQKIDTILQFTRSDQTNHVNHIIKIVPCKAALLRQEKQDS